MREMGGKMGLSYERSLVRFLVDYGGVRKGIRAQILPCHTSIQIHTTAGYSIKYPAQGNIKHIGNNKWHMNVRQYNGLYC